MAVGLHLVTGPHHPWQQVVETVKVALPWIDRVHLRMKGCPGKQIYLWGKRLIEKGRVPPEKLIINERVDVALALDCGGVHLPENSIPPVAEVRSLLREGMRLGCSVHSVHAADLAASEGADYLFFGHIYPTASKPGLPPRGLKQLQQVVEAVDIPVIAIGGVIAERVPEIMNTGCAGVAVISAILGQSEPQKAAQRLCKKVEG